MKRSLLIQTAAALIIVLVAMTGCKKEEDWSDEIGDLQQRVAELEELSADLKQKVEAGTMVESITPLSGGGWIIEFTSGNPIDVASSASNTDVSIGANGNWIIDGVDTGIRAEGRDGINGTNGEDGDTPYIGENGNWYIDGEDTGKPSRGADGKDGKDDDTRIYNIAENAADGTVTITLNDGTYTQYTFRKASTAVSFAILNAGTLKIAREETGVVRFAVNPSSAYISTNIAVWRLYDVSTGAAIANLTLQGIAPDGAAGQYKATIRRTAAGETVTAALKLNIGTAAAPTWISSSAFKIGMAPDIAKAPDITMTTNSNSAFRLAGTGTATINWGDSPASQTVTLTSTELAITHIYSDNATTHSITIYGENITSLVCYNNGLTSLDVSNNAALTRLNCHTNQLTNLNISNNTALTYLICLSNQLTSLDISKNTALTYLSCWGNPLTSLNVTKNTALTYLNCDNNQLTGLDVTNNKVLKNLSIQNNELTADGLNALFGTLHSNTITNENIYVIGNPGTSGCNKSIAQAKGWRVYTTTTGL